MFYSKMNSVADDKDFNCDLWVGNIDQKVDEKVLLEIFQSAGPIKSIRMPRVADGHKGFCFVHFYHENSVVFAINSMGENLTLFGKKLKLQPRSGSTHGKPKKEQLPDLVQQQVQLQQHHQQQQQQQQIPQGPQGQPLYFMPTTQQYPNMIVYGGPGGATAQMIPQYANANAVNYPGGGIQLQAVSPYFALQPTIQQQQQQQPTRLQQPTQPVYYTTTPVTQSQQIPQPAGYSIIMPNHPRPSNPSVLPNTSPYVQTSNFPHAGQLQFQQQQGSHQPTPPQQLNNNVGLRSTRPRLGNHNNSNNNGNRIAYSGGGGGGRGAMSPAAAAATLHQLQQQQQHPHPQQQQLYYPMFQEVSAHESQQYYQRQPAPQHHPQPVSGMPPGAVILNGFQSPPGAVYHY